MEFISLSNTRLFSSVFKIRIKFTLFQRNRFYRSGLSITSFCGFFFISTGQVVLHQESLRHQNLVMREILWLLSSTFTGFFV